MTEQTYIGTERRRQVDRRQNDRSGKIDRRKNRCGGCVFFGDNFCNKHQKPFVAEDFACVLFKPL